MAHSLSGGLKHLLLVGIGAAATSIDKAEALIDDLTRKGEITVEQGRILNEELKHKSEEAKRQATEKVDNLREASEAEADRAGDQSESER